MCWFNMVKCYLVTVYNIKITPFFAKDRGGFVLAPGRARVQCSYPGDGGTATRTCLDEAGEPLRPGEPCVGGCGCHTKVRRARAGRRATRGPCGDAGHCVPRASPTAATPRRRRRARTPARRRRRRRWRRTTSARATTWRAPCSSRRTAPASSTGRTTSSCSTPRPGWITCRAA
jgi:hypothetical protein